MTVIRTMGTRRVSLTTQEALSICSPLLLLPIRQKLLPTYQLTLSAYSTRTYCRAAQFPLEHARDHGPLHAWTCTPITSCTGDRSTHGLPLSRSMREQAPPESP